MGREGQGVISNKIKILTKERLFKECKLNNVLTYKILPFTLEVYSNLSDCFSLWNEFSPKRNIFETWEFRYAFYLGYKYKPYFLVAKRKKEKLALLPLWFDETKKIFTFFGSDWQEENCFFGKDLEAIKILLKLAPQPLYLNALTKEAIEDLKNDFDFKEEEAKYVLNLKDFKRHEDWLMNLKKNKRRNLRKDRNRIVRQNPEIIYDQFSDFEKLIDLAKERFKEKGEETDWEDKRRIETFRQVINLGGNSYKVRMITVKIGGKYAGIDLIGLFKDRYYSLKCAYNIKEFKGIGNFLTLLEIDDAIKLGFKKIDFLQEDYQWKSRYFESIPLFKYEKKIPN